MPISIAASVRKIGNHKAKQLRIAIHDAAPLNQEVKVRLFSGTICSNPKSMTKTGNIFYYWCHSVAKPFAEFNAINIQSISIGDKIFFEC